MYLLFDFAVEFGDGTVGKIFMGGDPIPGLKYDYRLWKPSFTITLVRLYIFGDEVGNRLSNFLARYDSELGGNFIILVWPNVL